MFYGVSFMLKLSVDRIVNSIAVCYDDNDKKFEIPALGLAEGDVISAELDESGKLCNVYVLKEETERKKAELALRTKNLFNRKKK